MQHVFRHDLEPAVARRAAGSALASYEKRYARYHPEVVWESDTVVRCSFVARGFRLRATVELLPGAARVDMQVPLILRPFRVLAIARVERELRGWCERAKNGELD